MSKTLFIENSPFLTRLVVTDELKESIQVKQGKNNTLIVKNIPGTILNRTNQNGRIYSTAEIQKAIEAARPQIETKQLLCSCDEHPEGSFVSPSHAAFVIIGAYIKKNVKLEVEGEQGTYDVLFCDIEVLNTSEGKNLQALLLSGCSLGTSIRGLGDMDGDQVVNYEFLGFDIVSNPSSGTFTNMPIYEAKIESVEENALNEATKFTVSTYASNTTHDLRQAMDFQDKAATSLQYGTITNMNTKMDQEVDPKTGVNKTVGEVEVETSDDTSDLKTALEIAGRAFTNPDNINVTSITIEKVDEDDMKDSVMQGGASNTLKEEDPVEEPETKEPEEDSLLQQIVDDDVEILYPEQQEAYNDLANKVKALDRNVDNETFKKEFMNLVSQFYFDNAQFLTHKVLQLEKEGKDTTAVEDALAHSEKMFQKISDAEIVGYKDHLNKKWPNLVDALENEENFPLDSKTEEVNPVSEESAGAKLYHRWQKELGGKKQIVMTSVGPFAIFPSYDGSNLVYGHCNQNGLVGEYDVEGQVPYNPEDDLYDQVLLVANKINEDFGYETDLMDSKKQEPKAIKEAELTQGMWIKTQLLDPRSVYYVDEVTDDCVYLIANSETGPRIPLKVDGSYIFPWSEVKDEEESVEEAVLKEEEKFVLAVDCEDGTTAYIKDLSDDDPECWDVTDDEKSATVFNSEAEANEYKSQKILGGEGEGVYPNLDMIYAKKLGDEVEEATTDGTIEQNDETLTIDVDGNEVEKEFRTPEEARVAKAGLENGELTADVMYDEAGSWWGLKVAAGDYADWYVTDEGNGVDVTADENMALVFETEEEAKKFQQENGCEEYEYENGLRSNVVPVQMGITDEEIFGKKNEASMDEKLYSQEDPASDSFQQEPVDEEVKDIKVTLGDIVYDIDENSDFEGDPEEIENLLEKHLPETIEVELNGIDVPEDNAEEYIYKKACEQTGLPIKNATIIDIEEKDKEEVKEDGEEGMDMDATADMSSDDMGGLEGTSGMADTADVSSEDSLNQEVVEA